jgi:hypothetical protein
MYMVADLGLHDDTLIRRCHFDATHFRSVVSIVTHARSSSKLVSAIEAILCRELLGLLHPVATDDECALHEVINAATQSERNGTNRTSCQRVSTAREAAR